MKSSKPIYHIPAESIDRILHDTGLLKDTAAQKVLEKSKGFFYPNVLGKLKYIYITCQPNIGYTITTLSKRSSGPSTYHYKLLRGVTKYFLSTI